MTEISKQLKKGVIEILILKLLSRENRYGYQLLQDLDTKSGGVFKMKEGTLYPVLYRLEDSREIESYWEQEPRITAPEEKRGIPRKYYRITDKGRTDLVKMIEDLNTLVKSINSVLEEEF